MNGSTHAKAAVQANTAEMHRALAVLADVDQVIELRALDVSTASYRKSHTQAGYYHHEHRDRLAHDAAQFTPTARGVYFTVNPVRPALLARAANRVREAKDGEATADKDIVTRRWLVVDVDPVRPAGICATTEERMQAHKVATAVRRDLLDSLGWPEPVVVDSGNGYYGLWRIDEPAADNGLVQRCLLALAAMHDTAEAHIDTSMFNPARIIRLPGTVNRKGDDTEDRPHRLCRILALPDALDVVSHAQLTALADTLPPEPEPARGTASAGPTFDLAGFITRHNLDVGPGRPWQNGTRWVFNVCPFDAGHTNKSAVLLQFSSGAVAFRCHHNSCQANDWAALRARYEPKPGTHTSHAGNEQEPASTVDAGDAPKRGPSMATLLVQLAENWDLFHDADATAYATVAIGDTRQTYRLNSPAAKRLLHHAFYLAHATAPRAQAVSEAFSVLAGRAHFDGPLAPVAVRVAGHAGNIWLDLADESWQAIEISPDGWRIVPSGDVPVRFVRPKGVLALPVPVRGGNLALLHKYINVKDAESWKLIDGWLMAAFRPDGPYPVLVLAGQQGAGKSNAGRLLRAVVDPNKAALRSAPREERDLAIAASNGWIVALDNLSNLPDWLSDSVCRLSTGGGVSTRKLYEDDEETIFDYKRPCIINSIEAVIERGDLLDRAVLVELEPIAEDQRKSERELWQDFEQDKPLIIGALLDGVAGALKKLPTTHLAKLPRMADFALWCTAAEPALGWESGSFMAAYSANRADANELALEAAIIVQPLRSLLAALPSGAWKDTASDLLIDLEAYTDEKTRASKGWPAKANVLSGMLKRIAPNLGAVGIRYSKDRETAPTRRWIHHFVLAPVRDDSKDKPSPRSPRSTADPPPPEETDSENLGDPLGDHRPPIAHPPDDSTRGNPPEMGDLGDLGDEMPLSLHLTQEASVHADVRPDWPCVCDYKAWSRHDSGQWYCGNCGANAQEEPPQEERTTP